MAATNDDTTRLLGEILAELKSTNRNARLWDVQDIAEYFKLAKSSVYNRLLCKRDFPRAIEIEGVGRRWKPAEIKAYAERGKFNRGDEK